MYRERFKYMATWMFCVALVVGSIVAGITGIVEGVRSSGIHRERQQNMAIERSNRFWRSLGGNLDYQPNGGDKLVRDLRVFYDPANVPANKLPGSRLIPHRVEDVRLSKSLSVEYKAIGKRLDLRIVGFDSSFFAPEFIDQFHLLQRAGPTALQRTPVQVERSLDWPNGLWDWLIIALAISTFAYVVAFFAEVLDNSDEDGLEWGHRHDGTGAKLTLLLLAPQVVIPRNLVFAPAGVARIYGAHHERRLQAEAELNHPDRDLLEGARDARIRIMALPDDYERTKMLERLDAFVQRVKSQPLADRNQQKHHSALELVEQDLGALESRYQDKLEAREELKRIEDPELVIKPKRRPLKSRK